MGSLITFQTKCVLSVALTLWKSEGSDNVIQSFFPSGTGCHLTCSRIPAAGASGSSILTPGEPQPDCGRDCSEHLSPSLPFELGTGPGFLQVFSKCSSVPFPVHLSLLL